MELTVSGYMRQTNARILVEKLNLVGDSISKRVLACKNLFTKPMLDMAAENKFPQRSNSPLLCILALGHIILSLQ